MTDSRFRRMRIRPMASDTNQRPARHGGNAVFGISLPLTMCVDPVRMFSSHRVLAVGPALGIYRRIRPISGLQGQHSSLRIVLRPDWSATDPPSHSDDTFGVDSAMPRTVGSSANLVIRAADRTTLNIVSF